MAYRRSAVCATAEKLTGIYLILVFN